MHELAMAIGQPISVIEQMPEAEFAAWRMHAARRLLWPRRVELLLAQVAQLIAVTMGGVKNAKLADYLFDPADDDASSAEAGAPLTAEDVAAMFGGTVIRDAKD